MLCMAAFLYIVFVLFGAGGGKCPLAAGQGMDYNIILRENGTVL